MIFNQECGFLTRAENHNFMRGVELVKRSWWTLSELPAGASHTVVLAGDVHATALPYNTCIQKNMRKGEGLREAVVEPFGSLFGLET